ncbi:hypothetical protein K438DRAFT_2013157 [Mycena galopus ATCC 62051]|nr:hypothetical protein K438DRAFT_2013157 [Mycena galopus ATCC 62051]
MDGWWAGAGYRGRACTRTDWTGVSCSGRNCPRTHTANFSTAVVALRVAHLHRRGKACADVSRRDRTGGDGPKRVWDGANGRGERSSWRPRSSADGDERGRTRPLLMTRSTYVSSLLLSDYFLVGGHRLATSLLTLLDNSHSFSRTQPCA